MSEYDTPGAPTPPPSAPSAPRDEWEDVKRSLDDLADAMTKWARAVKNDPENRRHAGEIRDRFESMGRDMGKAIDSAVDSDFMRGMGDAAGKAGDAVVDAAKTVGKEARPFMASAFRTAAEGMRVIAEKVESAPVRAAVPVEPTGEPVQAPEPPATPTAEEPPAPAPSGTPEARDVTDPRDL